MTSLLAIHVNVFLCAAAGIIAGAGSLLLDKFGPKEEQSTHDD